MLESEDLLDTDKNKKKATKLGSSSFKGSSKLSFTPKLNPMNRREVSLCTVCDSKMHWISKCLHKSGKRLQSANVIEENDRVLNKSDEESFEDVKMVLLTNAAMDMCNFYCRN